MCILTNPGGCLAATHLSVMWDNVCASLSTCWGREACGRSSFLSLPPNAQHQPIGDFVFLFLACLSSWFLWLSSGQPWFWWLRTFWKSIKPDQLLWSVLIRLWGGVLGFCAQLCQMELLRNILKDWFSGHIFMTAHIYKNLSLSSYWKSQHCIRGGSWKRSVWIKTEKVGLWCQSPVMRYSLRMIEVSTAQVAAWVLRVVLL